jgi:hypothetical protein
VTGGREQVNLGLGKEVVNVADDRTLPFGERAYENYRGEMEDIEKIWALLQEEEIENVKDYREPLSCDERREITILLSWGGPSDGYKIYFDKNNEPIEGYYFFSDWCEYEQFKLTDQELDRVLTVYPVSPAN